MFCHNCGTTIDSNSSFCYKCGTKLVSPQIEDKSSNEDGENVPVEHSDAECQEAATGLNDSQTDVEHKVSPLHGIFSILKTHTKKLIIGTSCVLACLLVFMAYQVFVAANIENHTVIYLKGNDLMARVISQDKSVELTDSYPEDSYYYLYDSVRQSKDGKKILYIENIDNGQGDLYLKEMGKSEKGTKLASNIEINTYKVSEDFTKVFYYKEYNIDDGGKLYVHDFKDEIKIESEVVSFEIIKDGEEVIYIKKDGDEKDLYVIGTKDNAENDKIASDVSNLVYITVDAKKIYYTKTDDLEKGTEILYFKKGDQAPVKIADNINYIYAIKDDESLLYTKLAKKELNFNDLFEDDMAEKDKNQLESPDIDDYQETIQDSYWGYSYYSTDYDSYYEDMDKYNQQKYQQDLRNGIRLYFQEEKLEVDISDLYLYANNKEEKVKSNVGSDNYLSKKGNPVFYGCYMDDDKRIKMSTILTEDDLDEVMSGQKLSYFIRNINGNHIPIMNDETLHMWDGNEDFSKLYIISEYDEETQMGILTEIEIGDEAIKKTEKIAKNVGDMYYYSRNDILVYVTDLKDEGSSFRNVGSLYIKEGDKIQRIAEDVNTNNITTKDDGRTIFYLSDYSNRYSYGNLCEAKGLTERRIASEVYSYYLRNDFSVLYISEYDKEKDEGELWWNQGKDLVKLDDEVSWLMYW